MLNRLASPASTFGNEHNFKHRLHAISLLIAHKFVPKLIINMLFNAREMNIYYTCLRQRKTLGTKVINQDAGGSAVTVLVFITLFPISISNNILTNANGDKTKTLTVLRCQIELYLLWSIFSYRKTFDPVMN